MKMCACATSVGSSLAQNSRKLFAAYMYDEKKRKKKHLDVMQSSSFHLLEKDITVRFTEAIKAAVCSI